MQAPTAVALASAGPLPWWVEVLVGMVFAGLLVFAVIEIFVAIVAWLIRDPE
jgi:hypothetical protein